MSPATRSTELNAPPCRADCRRIRDENTPQSGPSRSRTPAARVPPYSQLAAAYDRLVGNVLSPIVRQSFERALREFGVTFRSAADIGCGTGAFLAYLLRYQVPLWGVDISPDMLRIAARRLPSRRVRLLRQDIRRLALPRPVELIACNGDTLNYLLTPQELTLTLGRCSANLTPGGHLVGDLLIGVPDRAAGHRTMAGLAPGAVGLWRARTDPRRRLTRVDIRHGRLDPEGWHWVQETHLQRWHCTADLHAALHEAGLGVCALWRLAGGKGTGGAWIKVLARRIDGTPGPGSRGPCTEARLGRKGGPETAETDGRLDRYSH
jgi:SAM-dependent methyltransferase